MRKYAETLVNAQYEKKQGNHMVFFSDPEEPPTYYTTFLDDKTGKWVEVKGATRSFLYHQNVVCVVDDRHEIFWLSHAGWYTTSTSQALGQYKTYFSDLGYKCMTD
jgi:hypothetical protein